MKLIHLTAAALIITSGAALADTHITNGTVTSVQHSFSSSAVGSVTVVSGSTSLRYDTTAGQFQYNWKLPTGAGTCYELKMTAKDGSWVVANFKLK